MFLNLSCYILGKYPKEEIFLCRMKRKFWNARNFQINLKWNVAARGQKYFHLMLNATSQDWYCRANTFSECLSNILSWIRHNFDLTPFIKSLKFMYSEKATKFCEISTLDLTTMHTVKYKVEILQNFVAFSEYMNFKANCASNSKTFCSRLKSWIFRQSSVSIKMWAEFA